jgi:hypothetical protein
MGEIQMIKNTKICNTKFYKKNKIIAIYDKHDETLLAVVDNYKELAHYLKIKPRDASDALHDFERRKRKTIMQKYHLHFITLTKIEINEMGVT